MSGLESSGSGFGEVEVRIEMVRVGKTDVVPILEQVGGELVEGKAVDGMFALVKKWMLLLLKWQCQRSDTEEDGTVKTARM